jgi:predicted secreted protein
VTSNRFCRLKLCECNKISAAEFVAKIAIDTTIGKLSLLSLNSIKVNYVPTAEFVWDINTLNIQSTYKVGDELKFTTNIYNAGYTDIQGLIVNVYKKEHN